jgi:hypothetical protein
MPEDAPSSGKEGMLSAIALDILVLQETYQRLRHRGSASLHHVPPEFVARLAKDGMLPPAERFGA